MRNRHQRWVAPLIVLVGIVEPASASLRTGGANSPRAFVSSRSTETIAGRQAETWRVTRIGRTTEVRWASGPTSWSRRIAAPFGLPVVTSRGLRAGPTLDGSTIALAAAPRRVGTDWSSSFAVVTKARTHTISLVGEWAFDAISPNGRMLFLTESVGRGRYWVRGVDVTTGQAGEPLVTKTIGFAPSTTAVEDGPMEGLPLDRVASSDGRTIYTLYDGPSHPFIHALSIADGWALCYDLPDTLRSRASVLLLRPRHALETIDVVEGGAVLAQITMPGSRWGPTVRVAGTGRPPVVK